MNDKEAAGPTSPAFLFLGRTSFWAAQKGTPEGEPASSDRPDALIPLSEGRRPGDV